MKTIKKVTKKLVAKKETDTEKRDRMYKEARAGKKISGQTTEGKGKGSSEKTVTRTPGEYFSGKKFDATTKRALKESGVD